MEANIIIPTKIDVFTCSSLIRAGSECICVREMNRYFYDRFLLPLLLLRSLFLLLSLRKKRRNTDTHILIIMFCGESYSVLFFKGSHGVNSRENENVEAINCLK